MGWAAPSASLEFTTRGCHPSPIVKLGNPKTEEDFNLGWKYHKTLGGIPLERGASEHPLPLLARVEVSPACFPLQPLRTTGTQLGSCLCFKIRKSVLGPLDCSLKLVYKIVPSQITRRGQKRKYTQKYFTQAYVSHSVTTKKTTPKFCVVSILSVKDISRDSVNILHF